MVGVAQSMYQIERYVHGNDRVTAALLQGIVDTGAKIKKLRGGLRRCRSTARVGTAVRRTATKRAAVAERRPTQAQGVGLPLRVRGHPGAGADRRGQAAGLDLGLRHRQEDHRGTGDDGGPRLQHPDRGGYVTSTFTGRGRRCPTPTPAVARPSWPRRSGQQEAGAHLRGRPGSSATSPTSATSPGPAWRRWNGPDRARRWPTWARAASSACSTWRRRRGRASTAHSMPQVNEQFRSGDIRHCYADTRRAAEVPSFKAETPFEVGLPKFLDWAAEEEGA
ncbi:MAG: hypothetical protein MZV64_34545 [Ignavibacteriales bacterium]|nr:hypothetical protein [Ignavibacteriales bacterium]